MLDPCLEFFETKRRSDASFTYEVIVIDDGSTDETGGLVLTYVDRFGSDTVRLLTLRPNQGKGAAIRKGMLAGRGQYLLMADGDGATEISDYDKLMAGMLRTLEAEQSQSTHEETQAGKQRQTPSARAASLPKDALGFALGSRAHLQEGSVAQRAFYRTVLMKGMHLCVRLLCTSQIKDTQCGFKLFTRPTADALFSQMHLDRWAFDIELVSLAQALGVPLVEVSVEWREVAGSKLIEKKLDVITASLTMLRDMLCVKLCYLFRIWRVEPLRPIPQR
jgi:dolichyl-phosphate beta-glucosyltransferase